MKQKIIYLVLVSFMLLQGSLGHSAVSQPRESCLIIGNGPEHYAIEALAKEFEFLNPQMAIDFFWHENAKPVEAVKHLKADIAVTGILEKDLPSSIVAWDGIAIVTNFANPIPIEEVTSDQLTQIFTGKVKYWSDLFEDAPDVRISIIHRAWNQNIRQGLQKLLGMNGSTPLHTKTVGTEAQTFKAINGDIYSISYVSMGPALQAKKDGYGINLLFVDGVEPEYQTVLEGSYSLRRPIVFVMQNEPSPVASAFLEYVLSSKGQRQIKIGASGLFQDKTASAFKYYPLTRK